MVHANPGLRPGLSSAVPTGLDFVMVVLTQGLSHIFVGLFTARLKPCPSFDSLFPSLLGSVKASCAVQIGPALSIALVPHAGAYFRVDFGSAYDER
jgi:hypothetical protein